jgi:hypothetical protein
MYGFNKNLFSSLKNAQSNPDAFKKELVESKDLLEKNHMNETIFQLENGNSK